VRNRSDLDAALGEIVRVLRPGAPLAIGTWGGAAGGVRWWRDPAGVARARFVSLRTDDGLRVALGRHGAIEEWTTWLGPDRLH
jgi:hypothetical protein